MTKSHSVEFFDSQFRRQVAEGEYALNDFEKLALEHVRGEVLDLGCGLGNFALEAARRGHRVRAYDASSTAIGRIRDAARREGLSLEASVANLAEFQVEGDYDTVVSIGLLMFLTREQGRALLAQAQRAVRPGGVAIINVLVEGTTFMAMFDPRGFHLFGEGELEACFEGWRVIGLRRDVHSAAGGTQKAFVTLVASRGGDESPRAS